MLAQIALQRVLEFIGDKAHQTYGMPPTTCPPSNTAKMNDHTDTTTCSVADGANWFVELSVHIWSTTCSTCIFRLTILFLGEAAPFSESGLQISKRKVSISNRASSLCPGEYASTNSSIRLARSSSFSSLQRKKKLVSY